MKKLLEKPWAKALAFLLTLLPGTAAVYGGVELVYIYVYNMHTDRRLDMLWAVTAVCAVAAAASLVFSLSAAGHWPGHEGIHLTWVEKIPVDLFVLGLTCVWYIYLDAVYYPSATLGLAVFVALAYLFVLAFTARCKAGTVLSDLLALRLLRLFSRGAVWTWRHLRRLFLGLPLAWKTAAVLLAVKVHPTTYWQLIPPGLIFVAVYAVCMWLFGLNRYERSLITAPLRRLSRR